MAISNYMIGGNLPFSNAGAGMFNSGANLGSQYAGGYTAALNLNKANYSNILQGYQQLMSGQQQAQAPIQQGYGNLQSGVANTIQGIDASQRQAIADSYAQQRGSASQSLISRGLGNSTVQNSVDRGLALDNQKANIALSNQTAQLQAGYQSQLGLAGLGYANQANMQNTALGSQQLGWMNSVNAPYPNAQAYSTLAQQQGFASGRRNNYGLQGAGGLGGVTGAGAGANSGIGRGAIAGQPAFGNTNMNGPGVYYPGGVGRGPGITAAQMQTVTPYADSQPSSAGDYYGPETDYGNEQDSYQGDPYAVDTSGGDY